LELCEEKEEETMEEGRSFLNVMASLEPMWLRFCCTRRNSHIIEQRFFFFGEISPTGDKSKPSATSRKEFLKRTSRTFAVFL
jgi:hypothetical protein